jgi:hypothetical protein
MTVSERIKKKEGWIQAWMASFWRMGRELTVLERVKERGVGEGWMKAWILG